jgi:membrane protein insertase Oxa1/YidC/SpoIIIJ
MALRSLFSFSATVILRVLTFPVVIQIQRNVANMANNNPEMVRLQQKVGTVAHNYFRVKP